jgi:hypothetical protein
VVVVVVLGMALKVQVLMGVQVAVEVVITYHKQRVLAILHQPPPLKALTGVLMAVMMQTNVAAVVVVHPQLVVLVLAGLGAVTAVQVQRQA